MHPGFLPVDETKTIVLILTLARSDVWTFPFAQSGRTKRSLLPKDRRCEDHVDGWESQWTVVSLPLHLSSEHASLSLGSD